ncbi:hypothetical protein AJ79_08656 [Helicocarpus griseus UAMH5409]|uniref:Uncharacterized protein n=1 Tax=Helicocarpus griseus UAMH5409 TaxID=1447875 RepID=A0A2B7WRL2_9EURO|nr:hypothetical protein AJ79_08656 [Helicocarpus griseus UAMH5409]
MDDDKHQIPLIWNLVSPLLPPLLSAQRASWEQGTAAQAILELHYALLASPLQNTPHGHSDPMRNEHTRQTLQYLYGLCHDAVVRASTDCRLATRINSNDEGDGDASALDPACIGEAALFVLEEQIEHSEGYADSAESLQWQQSLEGMLLYLLDFAPRVMLCGSAHENASLLSVGAISHLKARPELWADGVYMGPAFLAAVALSPSSIPAFAAMDEEKKSLLGSAFDQILLYSHYLENSISRLMGHVYAARATSEGPFTNGKYGHRAWGVGNGWFIGGIMRVLKILDRDLHGYGNNSFGLKSWLAEDHKSHNRVGKVWRQLISLLDAIICSQREDGLFHNIIDDPTTFVETNLAQMAASVVYDILSWYDVDGRPIGRLVTCAQFLLDKAKLESYRIAAENMYLSARSRRDSWGFVRGVCGSPRFDKPGTAAEGQAWAIMMEVSRWKWLLSQAEAAITPRISS